MSYTIDGWVHGHGFSTIDLTGLSCCFCHEDLGLIAQYQLTGMELYKCGEYNYSQMAHSWCVAFEELYDAWHEEHGYDWQWDERYMTPAKAAQVAEWKREREAEYGEVSGL
jgi:hypothetical protein